MKSKKLLTAKLFMGASYLSMLTASCVPQEYLDEETKSDNQRVYDSHVILPISAYKDIHGINIRSYMSFAYDILTDSTLCQTINENPEIMIDRYGFTIDELDNKEREMLFALGDPEVQAALMDGDFKAYLGVLEKKNILQSNTIKYLNDYLSPTKTVELTEQSPIIDKTPQECVFVAPVAVYTVVAGLAAVVAEMALAVRAAVVLWTSTYIAGKQNVTKSIDEDYALYLFRQSITQSNNKNMNYNSDQFIEAQQTVERAVDFINKNPKEVRSIVKKLLK